MRPVHVTRAIDRIAEETRAAGSITLVADVGTVGLYIAKLERELASHRCSVRSALRSMRHPSENRRRDDVADRQVLASRVKPLAIDPYTGNRVVIGDGIWAQTGDKGRVSLFEVLFWTLLFIMAIASFVIAFVLPGRV